ncbi:hypothetical protein WA158_007892 [Blastocystis sp. Blastoise]
MYDTLTIPDWQDQYLSKRFNYFEKTHKNNPEYLPPVTETKYSSNYLNLTSSTNGLHWGILYNVCFNIKHNKLFYYRKAGSEQQFTDSFYKDFGTLWTIVEEETISPISAHVEVSNDQWMIIPFAKRNIPHFAESHNFIIHYLMNQNDFPPMRVVYSPLYNTKTDNEWKLQYIDSLKDLFPSPHQLDIYGLTEMMDMFNKGTVCFKQLNIAGKLDHITLGGIYLSYEESLYFKASVFRKYNIYPHIEKRFKTNGMLVLRNEQAIGQNPGRIIKNIEEVRSLFIEMNSFFTISEVYLETLPFKIQVQRISETDILIGAHGAGLINIMYMIPNSVVIDIFPPLFDEKWYNELADVNHIAFLSYHNFSAPYPQECIDSSIINANKQICITAIKSNNIHVNTNILKALLVQARIYLSNHKFDI